jgi:hypothetical protein
MPRAWAGYQLPQKRCLACVSSNALNVISACAPFYGFSVRIGMPCLRMAAKPERRDPVERWVRHPAPVENYAKLPASATTPILHRHSHSHNVLVAATGLSLQGRLSILCRMFYGVKPASNPATIWSFTTLVPTIRKSLDFDRQHHTI